MYCGKCGLKMPDEEFICPRCGADMTLPPAEERITHNKKKPGLLQRLLDRIAGK